VELLEDVDAVLIDVGGVLVLPADERVRGALLRLDIDTDALDLHRAHYEGVVALGEGPVGHHSDGLSIWHAYNRAYARVCGIPDERLDDATELLLDEFRQGDIWRQEIPGARDALAALAAHGLGLAIVSNADGTVEADLLRYSICQMGSGAGVTVGAILDSTVAGVAKPDPDIFHRALEALGVPPERAVHVGDTPAADVAGARAAGIRPVLVDPYDLHPDADCVRVRSLAGFVELLAT
jgi:putative hydrolase of the HAD superfamily